MSSSRLFQLLSLLLEQRRMTADELSSQLGVSVSTVYRDVDSLAEAGIPVCTSQGRGGGVWLPEGHRLDRGVFTREEQQLLLAALRSMPEQAEESALAKLSALFHPDQPDWLQVRLSRWGNTGHISEYYEQIRDAIVCRRILELTYAASPGETRRYSLLPARLVCLGQVWYCQGWCLLSEEYRLFRLSRITALTVTKQPFHRPLHPPELPLSDEIPPLFQINATLRFAPSAAQRVYDEFDESCICEQEDGSLLVRTVFSREPWLYGYLLSFGTELEVLSPASLRAQIACTARTLSLLYQDDLE